MSKFATVLASLRRPQPARRQYYRPLWFYAGLLFGIAVFYQIFALMGLIPA